MTTPALAAYRFAAACLLGTVLGIVYSFLRPLRRKGTALADGLFLLVLGYAWLQLGFRICRGDLRIGYTAGLFMGILAWEMTFGKWLRPVFFGFWAAVLGAVRWIVRPVQKFFQKISEILKFLFASLKKWVTMKMNNRRSRRRRTGGSHGEDQKPVGIYQTGTSKNTGADENRSVGGRCIVYGGPSDASRSH